MPDVDVNSCNARGVKPLDTRVYAKRILARIYTGIEQDQFLILTSFAATLLEMVEFEQILKNQGYRLTNQRRVIVRELEGERHLSAEEIYDRVKGDHPELGLSTVYRTLDLLTELGIVRKDDFGEGYSRYELATERMHHHARCEECGNVIEFNEELMEYLALQVERETGFVTDWHEITLHGRCAACANSDNTQKH